MKKIHVLIVLSILILFTSCGMTNTFLSSHKLQEIQLGMTRQEVKNVLGTFDYRRFNGDSEEWEFHRYMDAGWSIVIVEFVDGKVASMDTFERPVPPAPAPQQGVTVVPVPVSGTSYGEGGRPRPHRKAMNKEEFAGFVDGMKRQFTTSDRISYIEKAVPYHWFTSTQCARLVKEFSFSDEQAKIAKTIYPHVVDKENFNVVFDVLPFGFNKDGVIEYVKQYNKKNRK